ncbi:MAG TPA: hypothetical protein VF165_14120 [Nocardioidaceae bacterium]
MSATPVYDAVLRDLKIDPERIAARPRWSFELAERVRKHRRRELRSTRRKDGQQTPRAQARSRPAMTTPTRRTTTGRPAVAT